MKLSSSGQGGVSAGGNVECMPAVNEPIHAPEFQPGGWLNSPPLSVKALRGQVLLVEFWDFTCINCLRALPYLREWWRRYQDAGLVIVGIHSPEFEFAKDANEVRGAVEELGLAFPILLDNELHNWHAWANRYWPARYLVDKDGCISYFHFGEGDYVGVEWNIQLLLRQAHPGAVYPPPMSPLRASDEPGAVCYKATPELYLGYQRAQIGNAEPLRPDRTTRYTLVGEEKVDTIYLEGHWHSSAEAVTLAMEVGSLIVRYRGKEVNVVLTPPPGGAGIVEVLQDGAMPSIDEVGKDVCFEDNAMLVHVDRPRCYQVINNPRYGTHTLRLLVRTPGISAYTLAFITECVEETGEAAA